MSTHFTIVHRSATDFLDAAYPALHAREREANTILPYALKARSDEGNGARVVGDASVRAWWAKYSPSRSSVQTPPRFWITCWSKTSQGPVLDFALSCTEGPLGTYPLFFFSTRDDRDITTPYLSPRLSQLACQLKDCAPPQRAFSIFGPEQVIREFVAHWSALTGFIPMPNEYYAAHLSFCTRETLTPPAKPLPSGHIMRLAQDRDAQRAAILCGEFASDSPFPLDSIRSLAHARDMIRKQQLWVYECYVPTGEREIATIVAVTRNTEESATITKVYTSPSWRGNGCAERLVRHVTDHLLHMGGKTSVALYVAYPEENMAANVVYHRVGFVGLCGNSHPRVSRWLEVGFAGTDNGHW
ncbi:hypothetical protein BOTBODRAFT_104610 [Botryobasidium botryosum FD-172 SS1]|uniref:N-acetyltransferase domain-containing protein n=1 Tax=Botryobasidium botryosum (strain FD-172 SS1) TaxID=930990 RepID=A0A067MRA6_BOTB1|nr:hypothetical protein BOTBODRAFT_104610 [Botryobasidium botryosum FD-172 SS1]